MKRESNLNIRISKEERAFFKKAAMKSGHEGIGRYMRWCAQEKAEQLLGEHYDDKTMGTRQRIPKQD